jgi:FkbM family methyltransferase
MKRTIRNIKLHFRILGLKGLLYWIMAKVTRSTLYFEVARKDCAHPFRLRIPSSDVRTYMQIFVRQEYDFKVKTEPKTIVDAGANIGLAAIYFANRYPDARIISLEPEQSNFELLKANTAPYPNITPVHAALWHRNEEIDLIDPGRGKWAFMTQTKDSAESLPGNAHHVVAAMTVDKIMKDYGMEKIDILKIDIEGAEKEVFSDTTPWINQVDSLIIELHERLKTGCNRSFYCGSNGFDNEWKQGENVYLSRSNYLTRGST